MGTCTRDGPHLAGNFSIGRWRKSVLREVDQQERGHHGQQNVGEVLFREILVAVDQIQFSLLLPDQKL